MMWIWWKLLWNAESFAERNFLAGVLWLFDAETNRNKWEVAILLRYRDVDSSSSAFAYHNENLYCYECDADMSQLVLAPPEGCGLVTTKHNVPTMCLTLP